MDIENYCQRLSQRDAGEDLEYDSQFHALTLAIEQGGEDVQYGDQIYQAPEIDWRWGAEQCELLLQRSLDLRVAVYQVHAWLMQQGLSGLLAGLQVVLYLLEKRWEDVHPQLSQDDNWDPLCRLNSLAYLSAPHNVIARVKKVSLFNTAKGELCFDVLDGGKGTEETSEANRELESLLQMLTEPNEVHQLRNSFDALKASLDTVQLINVVLSGKIGSFTGGNVLKNLELLLQRMVGQLQTFIKSSHGEIRSSDAEDDNIDNTNSILSLNDAFRNRQEVICALDAVCQYYRNYEPNSPIPLLIKRAKKLINMDFLEIINELIPEGNNEIKKLVGQMANNE